MEKFPMKIAIILLIFLMMIESKSYAATITIDCKPSECLKTCKAAYGNKLIKSYCVDLSPTLPGKKLCVCEHSKATAKGGVDKSFMSLKPSE